MNVKTSAQAIASLLTGALSLGGCASMGGQVSEVDQLRNDWAAKELAGYHYAYGEGATRLEAEQMAARRIAQQVSLVIRSEYTQVYERTQDERGSINKHSEQIESRLASLVQADMEGLEPVRVEPTRQGYLAASRMEEGALLRAQERSRRQASALARIAAIEQLSADQAVPRLQLAQDAQSMAESRGIGSDRVNTEALGSTTFGEYFQYVADRSRERLVVLPLHNCSQDGRIRLALIDQHTHAPQGDASLKINEKALNTDRTGQTQCFEVDHSAQSLGVELVGRGGAMDAWRIGEIRPQRWETATEAELYIHVDPDGLPVEIDYSYMTAPARIRLPNNQNYDYSISGGQHYVSEEGRFHVPEGAVAVYLQRSLRPLSFGDVELQLEGPGQIKLHGPEQVESNHISGRLKSGDYNVIVWRDGEEYQTGRDSFTLERGGLVHRIYDPAQNREPFWEGNALRMDLVQASRPQSNLMMDGLGQGGSASFGDIQNGKLSDQGIESISAKGVGVGLAFHYQVFSSRGFFPLTYGIGGGYRTEEYNLDLGDESLSVELNAYHLSGQVGTFAGFRDGVVGHFALGATYENRTWNQLDRDQRQHVKETSWGTFYPYMEAGFLWNEVAFSVRAPVKNDGVFTLNVGFGKNNFHREFMREPSRSLRENDGYRVITEEN